MKHLAFAFALALLLSSCCERPKLIKKIYAGVVVSAEFHSRFNGYDSTIETSTAIFSVAGLISVIKGESATIFLYDDNRRYLCFESRKNCALIY